ncbi:hypothetical protein EDC01DRAFT_705710 [Geopyxis carbonaria]|nr:hypothetical protein EDC01DRAFT_705710 [Geopyxis carbonaria]
MSDDDPMRSASPQKRPRTASTSPAPAAKPAAAAAAANDDSSSDDDIGPMLPPAPGAARKKRRVLPHELEKLYLAALPSQPRYTKSLMHREPVLFTVFTPGTDFLITASADGVVKFWKKMAEGIEFVKMYRAHQGEIVGVSASCDGRSFASAGKDGKVVIFDVVTFDLLTTIQLEHPPRTICWVHARGAALPLLAVSDSLTPTITIYDARADAPRAVHTLTHLHRAIVHLIALNSKYNCVISADESGMVEYWTPSAASNFAAPPSVFEFKASTGLFAFKKSKSIPTSIVISPTQESWAAFSFPDRLLRVFDFPSARLARTYDESLETLAAQHHASSAASKLPDLEFGRRMALESALTAADYSRANAVFDESGHLLIYPALAGIKVLNLSSNKVVRTLARDEPLRALHLALYQGAPQRKALTTIEMAASANPLLQESEARDPLLVATAAGKSRFYIFSTAADAPKSSERDVYNEKPLAAAGAGAGGRDVERAPKDTGAAAIMHTSMGDIHLRLFPEAAPKTVENFVTHARAGYYNGTIFHRVIKKFMIQAGDPNGDGTGGESIWGGEFEDEFSSLRHDKPYTLSSANYGPNTNGSQFFITTDKTPWLDNKHTIFGRAIQGLDVIHQIESVRTYKEKPEDDIKIINISVL